MSQPRDKDSGLTVEQLKKEYSYNPFTGKFLRLRKVNQAGERVGWVNPVTGYLIICVRGRRYMAHRLAWFYVYGRWPNDRLDHKNVDQTDNRISNLREANNQQNSRNRATFKNNRLGIKGIRLHENGRYQARIFDGHHYRTRVFETLDAAIRHHDQISREVFGEYASMPK